MIISLLLKLLLDFGNMCAIWFFLFIRICFQAKKFYIFLIFLLFLFNKPRNGYNFGYRTCHKTKHKYIYKNEPNIKIHSCNILLHFCYEDEIQLQSNTRKVAGNNKTWITYLSSLKIATIIIMQLVLKKQFNRICYSLFSLLFILIDITL